MANFLSLPRELQDLCLSYASRNVLKALRLTCRKTCALATRVLFNDVYFSLTPQSWENLQLLSASDSLNQHARNLHFDPKLLPYFQDQDAFEKALDTRLFKGQYLRARSLETGEHAFIAVETLDSCSSRMSPDLVFSPNPAFERSYEMIAKGPWESGLLYEQYSGLVTTQHDFLRKLDHQRSNQLADVIARFSGLTRLRAAPWWEDFFDKPALRYDGTRCQYAMFLHFFKQKAKHVVKWKKDGDLHPNTLWAWGFASEVQRLSNFAPQCVFRHLMVQDRMSTTCILPRSSAEKQLPCLRTLQLSLSFHTGNSRHADDVHPGWHGYEHNTASVARDLTNAPLINLMTLELDVEFGNSFRNIFQIQMALCETLHEMRSLKNLKMALYKHREIALHDLETSLDPDFDALQYICEAGMYELQTLHLSYARTTEETFEKFLLTKQAKLGTLHLRQINFSHGSWPSLLDKLPHILELREFSARDLTTSIEPEPKAIYFKEGYDEDNESVYQPVWDYVTRTGPWSEITDEADVIETAGTAMHDEHRPLDSTERARVKEAMLEEHENRLESWDDCL